MERNGSPGDATAAALAVQEEKLHQKNLEDSDNWNSNSREQEQVQRRSKKQQQQQIQRLQQQQQPTRGDPAKQQLEHHLLQHRTAGAFKVMEEPGKKKQQNEEQTHLEGFQRGGNDDGKQTRKRGNGGPVRQQKEERTEKQQIRKKTNDVDTEEEQRSENTEKEKEEKEKFVCGSGLQTVGGETPVEQCPEEKYTVEKDVLLCDSIIWKLLEAYYKRMAIAAWSQELVPSFVTSNSRLCRSYARIIFAFLQDWYIKERKDKERKSAQARREERSGQHHRQQQQQHHTSEPTEKPRQAQHHSTRYESQDRHPHHWQQQEAGEQEEEQAEKHKKQQDEPGREKATETGEQQIDEQRLHLHQGEDIQENNSQVSTSRTTCDLDGIMAANGEDQSDDILTHDTLKTTTPISAKNAISPLEKSSHCGVTTTAACSCAAPLGGTPVAAVDIIGSSVAATKNCCATTVRAGRGGQMSVSRQTEVATRFSQTAAAARAEPATAAATTAAGTAKTAATAATAATEISEYASLLHSSSSFPRSCVATDDSIIHCPVAAAPDFPPRVLILEIGGGHGRFTFLLLKALLQFQHLFEDLDMPAVPFLYVFSDVAPANVYFCEHHPALQPFIQQGWLDFAVFDGNQDRGKIFLRIRKTYVPQGTPIVAIANYVFDSLLTDAWRYAYMLYHAYIHQQLGDAYEQLCPPT